MKNTDPGVRHQKALPFEVIAEFCRPRESDSPLMAALRDLVLYAFFFAMRSCEYLKIEARVGEEVPRKTRPVKKKDLAFWKDHRLVPHDAPGNELFHANSVSTRYEWQKRDVRDDIVTQMENDDPFFNPVAAGARIAKRLEKMKRKGLIDDNAPIYCYETEDGEVGHISAKVARELLRTFVRLEVDYDAMGFHWEDIGLHSIRASAAMAMYLNGVPVCTIMLIGRWSSDAFLKYIRKQVEEFGTDVSRRMILRPRFHTVTSLHFHASQPNGNSFFAAREQPVVHNQFQVWGGDTTLSSVPITIETVA